jgi:ketosteroid isomerase-like protein
MPESSTEAANLQAARRYLSAVESGATGDALAAFFTDDVVQEEFPNRLVPTGARRDLRALLEGAERGQTVLTAQRYEIRNAIASGDHVALEVLWTGTLAIPIGSVPAGGEMRAHFGVFLEFRDGRIAAQRNYDCFDPF